MENSGGGEERSSSHGAGRSASSLPAAKRGGERFARSGRQLLTEVEVAKILTVSPRTLQNWRYRGGGPSYRRIGPRAVRYLKSDIEEFLKESARKSTSDMGQMGE